MVMERGRQQNGSLVRGYWDPLDLLVDSRDSNEPDNQHEHKGNRGCEEHLTEQQ